MNIGDEERKENIKTYFFRARKRNSGLVNGLDNQFYAEGLKDIWHSFDAFLGLYYADINNKLMRAKFCKDYQDKFEKWTKPDDFVDSVKRLKILSPIPDMSPIKPKKEVFLKDITSLSQILEASYRVRSNLNHGNKDLEARDGRGDRNRALVKFSFKVTYYILEMVFVDKKII